MNSVKGKITKVDTSFYYFEVNDCVRVHMGVLLVNPDYQKLPAVGSHITITKANGSGNKIILCEHSVIEGDFSSVITKNYFLESVIKLKLTVVDIFQIDKYITIMEKCFTAIEPDIKVKIIANIIHFTRKPVTNVTQCEHSQLPCSVTVKPYNIITVKDCHYVEVTSKKYKYFPMYSYGVHSKEKGNELLLGYLIIHPIYGHLMLKDKQNEIPLVIYRDSEENIASLSESFVLLKDYRIVTEIFNEENVPCLEYICVNYEDIIVLHENRAHYNNSQHLKKHKYCTKFLLIKKSTIQIGNTKLSECWLQVKMKEKDEESFLIITQKHITYLTSFREGCSYNLFHNVELKSSYNRTLSYIKPLKIYILNDVDAYFQLADTGQSLSKVMSVKECKEYINGNNMLSFEGVVKRRLFANKFSSRVETKTNMIGFGTQGSKTHQIVFSYTDDDYKEHFVDLYLLDWQNTVTPLGLIPQMRVIVRNVLPQSKKYIKSTALTSFEVVAYEPVIDFQTANLNENEAVDWGPSYFFGSYDKITSSVVIWGRVHEVVIKSLTITSSCRICSKKFETREMCMDCNTFERKPEILAFINVYDLCGESQVMVTDLQFLKLLFDLGREEYGEFLNDLSNVISFKYNHCSPELVYGRFNETLTSFLDYFNEMPNIWDLKCRRIFRQKQYGNGMQASWLYIDGRKVNSTGR